MYSGDEFYGDDITSGPEDNPADDEQPTREEWEAWEREQQEQAQWVKQRYSGPTTA
jgi:hypothetical protein